MIRKKASDAASAAAPAAARANLQVSEIGRLKLDVMPVTLLSLRRTDSVSEHFNKISFYRVFITRTLIFSLIISASLLIARCGCCH